MVHAGACVVLLVLVDSSLSLVNNSMIEARNALQELKDNQLRAVAGARRAYATTKKDGRSTSSDTGDSKTGESGSKDESLGLTFSESSEKEKEKKKKNKHIAKSTEERHGWKKWHRKCHPCPEDMKMKWRDPRVKWICGAFQRARRTFKSSCMMYYRNCQDGTMFVKIHDHRCQNTSRQHPIGDHFFYDYAVVLPVDSKSRSSEDSEEKDTSSATGFD